MRMAIVAMVLVAAGCGAEGDGAGGVCGLPDAPPAPAADYCSWGPECALCALDGQTEALYRLDGACAWREVWRARIDAVTVAQAQERAACADQYERTEGGDL